MTDNEVIELIKSALEGTDYKFLLFNRDHECFGNMIVIIGNAYQKLKFCTDRDEIWCGSNFLVPANYHTAGMDDCPLYLAEAIRKFLKK